MLKCSLRTYCIFTSASLAITALLTIKQTASASDIEADNKNQPTTKQVIEESENPHISEMDVDKDSLYFERDIRPLLKHHCFHCHGEDSSMEGGLDARLVHKLISGGDSGPAIVPGNHQESPLFLKIAAGEMPPGSVPLPPEDQKKLADWIDQGAKTSRPEPEAVGPDEFTEEERQHWSFQPIVKPALPSLPPTAISSNQPANPIDLFIQARLASHNESLSPEADRLTLIRRLSFDLVGLPPTIEQIDRFLNDTDPYAYDKLVDELLSAPEYGERWGRHWLDVAGYADSDGYTSKDFERKWAWKYRDYVIRSFNEDKPWNEFIIEQLAGDELLSPPYENLTGDEASKLIATGFLRMAPDGTADPEVVQDVARNDVMAETIKIVTSSLMGVTVGCAQCHTHRYDPITHTDYHRIRSIFEPAYNWKDWKLPAARLVSQWSSETREVASKIDAEVKQLQLEKDAELDALVEKTLTEELAKLPEDRRAAAKLAKETPVAERTDEQLQLIKEYPFLNVNRGSVYLYVADQLKGFNKKWNDKIAEVKNKRPAEDWIHCLTEVPGQAPLARLFARGDYQNPRDEVPPGDLSVLVADRTLPVKAEGIATSGRRLAFAQNLVDGKHPLVARVLVNRFWMHHFGQGIVASVGDFGFLGEKPTHPELLDWLAFEFMQNGWKLKPLHRLIVTSATYRQSSQRRPELDSFDPDNRLLGRMNLRRLEAEAIRDSILKVSGQLSPQKGGPPVPVALDEVGQVIIGVDTRDGAGRHTKPVQPIGEQEFRRSVYISVRRSMPLGVLEPFDAPLMSPNCEQRTVSTVAPQSLLMINSAFVVNQAEKFASQLKEHYPNNQEEMVTTLWRRTLGRMPTETEKSGALAFLETQRKEFEANPPTTLPKDANATAEHLALTSLCHALFSSTPFLYID